MPLAADEVFEIVRTKFLKIIGRKPVTLLEEETGVSRLTIAKFLAGHDIRIDCLRRIEVWCDAHERKPPCD